MKNVKKLLKISSYDFLTRNIFDPEHSIDDINKSKRKRIKKLWNTYTPPNIVNNENDLELENFRKLNYSISFNKLIPTIVFVFTSFRKQSLSNLI